MNSSLTTSTTVIRALKIQTGLLVLVWLALNSRPAIAQEEPGFRIRTFALKNARIVAGPGSQPEAGAIVVRAAHVLAVGANVEIPADADVIDAEGLTIYPGFIDAGTTSFLDDSKVSVVEGRGVDVSKYALAGMRHDDHSGLTPEFAAAEHLKMAAGEIDKHRSLGFVAVHVLPAGRIVSGRGAVVNLASLPLREALLSAGSLVTFQMSERGGGEYPATTMGAHAHLRQTFLDSERHARQLRLFAENVPGIDHPAADPVLETFQSIRTGRYKPIFIAGSRDDHDRALNLAAEHQLRTAIWGGQEAYRIADRLKKTETDLILQVDFGDEPKVEPPKPNEDPYTDLTETQIVRDHKLKQWKERVAGLAELKKASVRFAVSSRELKNPADLFKALRQAIANGLDRETALASMTTQAAAILGLDQELGTIAVGRPAYFVAMTGPFDHEQTKVRYVIINGRRYEYNKDAKPIEPTKPGEPQPMQVAGNWAVEIASADGPVHGELELSQSDRSLSGRFRSGQGDGRLTSGTVTSSGLDFIVSIGAGDSTIQLKFDSAGWTPPQKEANQSAVAPVKLQGNLKSPFGASTKWTATRLDAKPQATAVVQLTGIEVAGEPTSANPPVSALDPANNSGEKKATATSNLRLAADQPVEFTEDRKSRSITTGGNVLIRNGVVLTGTGQTLPGASILIKNGTIAAIGPDLQPEPGMTVIDATGRFVMPGIIDTHSHIMISNGIGGVNEATASIVCEVRIRDVVNSNDVSEYRALAGGVTTARLLHGSANCIGGQDAVVQLKIGSSAAEHLFPGAHSGVKFALGENVKARGGRFPNTRLGVEATLNRAFLEALDYRRAWMEYDQQKQKAADTADRLLPPRRDLRLEALVDILNHQKFIHSHCYRADEILMLLRVAENLGLRVWSLQHVLEGYKVAPEIVKHGASCSTFADWWAYKVEAYDAVPQNAALLHEAGANVCIKSDDWELIRHLYLEAAKTVRYGNMPPDAALQTITLNPARELGLSDRIGSIEVGKQGDLAIFSGHPLNAFSRCEQTLIAGEVYFTRDQKSSAMSPAAAASSAKPAELVLPKPQDRAAWVDLEAAKSGKYAIVGATVHPVDADDIPQGTVVIEDGKFVAVGKDLPLAPDAKVVRAEGLHLYPGLIDAGTSVGLIEIAKVRETSDLSEIGQFQADLRAGIALNPDSELIPVARAGGITTTLCLPAGGGNMTGHGRAFGAIIPGQASIVQLAGWTMPEMVLNMEAGLHLIWPSGAQRKGPIEDLKRLLTEARLYDKSRALASDYDQPAQSKSQVSSLIVDPRYEALRPYVRGEKPIYVEADTQQEIVEALHFANQESLKIVLCGVTDGWKVADKIKAAGIPLIVGPTMRKPIEDYDPFDAPYANAGRLHEAGIKICFRSDTASNSRNAPFEAAMAVAYGLPEHVALKAVTLSSAEILGVADSLGSIKVGKSANLILTDGSPLQITTQIKGIVIQGKPFTPESRQTKFYDKYRARVQATK